MSHDLRSHPGKCRWGLINVKVAEQDTNAGVTIPFCLFGLHNISSLLETGVPTLVPLLCFLLNPVLRPRLVKDAKLK